MWEKMMGRGWFTVVACVLLLVAASACSDDDGNGADTGGQSPEETASSCESAEQCFADVDIEGDAVCLDRVRGGHCTHTCSSDADCCAVDGECQTDLEQVCSPFESTAGMMCFLSCEQEDWQADGAAEDENEFCQAHVASDFICRSSGGGANNRKICVPGDCGLGATCDDDADCDGELSCLDAFEAGYCGVRGCGSNDDCPEQARCVDRGGDGICLRSCTADSDCTFCRFGEHGECTNDVEFVEDGTSGSVCLGG